MSGFGWLGVGIGTVQQQLDGGILVSGTTATVESKRLVIELLGDSNTRDSEFREELWRAFRKFRGRIKFLGSTGYGSITGGIVGRRLLGYWGFDGFNGRRFTQTVTASVDPNTDTWTLNGHTLVNGTAVILTNIAASLTGLSTGVLYWPINVTANTFQLSLSSLSSGTAVNVGGTTGNVSIGMGLIEMWPGIALTHDEAPDVVFLKCGTNDIFAGSSASAVLSSLSTMIDLIKITYPDAEIVVCSVVPVASGTSAGGNQATLNQVRSDYVAGIPGVVATKGSKVGYFDTANGIEFSDYKADGVHLVRRGYAKESLNYAEALNNLFPINGGSAGLTLPRSPKTRTAQPSMVLAANSDVLSIPFNSLLSPSNQNFAFGLWHYPTALPIDSAVRSIVKYGTSHPNGYLLGHFSSSGNGGGLIFYLTSGTPVFSGTINTAYAYENLKINKWHRIVIVCDRSKLIAGCFINGQLIQWAPIPSAWNVTQTEATKIGATSPFNAALGYTDRFFFARGSNITLNNALDYVEKDYYEGILMPGTTCAFDIDEGTGTNVTSETSGVTAGTITGATWIAALNTPKPGIDEAADGTGNAAA